MCGVFFSIGFENLPASVIDSVSHRGPDGRGWNDFVSSYGPVVLAHRRLSIIDLTGDGHQPMSSEDGRYWVTYNGEIYNYLEIRNELEKIGYHFKTKTDTEVLIKSYLHWGEDCLHKFNGMFAFIIWDDKEKKAFAARDRFGVKPLYYYRNSSKIAFASEIKQFKHLPGWESILNQEIAAEYLANGYCDYRRETLYQNVSQVLPGHYCNLTCDSKEFEKQICWYELKECIQPLRLKDEIAIAEFRELFKDAVRLRLRSDVTSGACLSGGLDSSSIVSIMHEIKEVAENIPTFSSVFPGHKVDEAKYIDELVVQKNLISNKNYPLYEEFLEKIDDILYYQDLPFAGTSVFAQWKTFESAKREGVVVLLDGQGADESLFGYPGMLNSIVFDYLKEFKLLSLFEFFKWQHCFNNQSPKNTILLGLQHRFPKAYISLLNMTQKNISNTRKQSFTNLTEVCLWHFSHDLQTLLRYEDRNSMAFSRESRLPFLDYRLVEFILSLSINQRFRKNMTKWILRKSMDGINIDTILKRKDKIGFATPEKEWLKSLKAMQPGQDFNRFIFKRWLVNENLSFAI